MAGIEKETRLGRAKIAQATERAWALVKNKLRIDPDLSKLPKIRMEENAGDKHAVHYVSFSFENELGLQFSGGTGHICVNTHNLARLSGIPKREICGSLNRALVHEMIHAARDRYNPAEIIEHAKLSKRLEAADEYSDSDYSILKAYKDSIEGLAVFAEGIINRLGPGLILHQAERYENESMEEGGGSLQRLSKSSHALGSYAAFHYLTHNFDEKAVLQKIERMLKSSDPFEISREINNYSRIVECG